MPCFHKCTEGKSCPWVLGKTHRRKKRKKTHWKKLYKLVLRWFQGKDWKWSSWSNSPEGLVSFSSRNRWLTFLWMSILVRILLKGSRKKYQANWKWNQSCLSLSVQKWALNEPFYKFNLRRPQLTEIGYLRLCIKMAARKRRVQGNF